MRLTCWQEKGVAWGSAKELTGLQTCAQNMISRKIKLVNVIQVMLIRRVLPCQRRTCYLWEYDPSKHQMLLELFGTTHEDIWKVLFKSRKSWPDSAEDRGYKLTRPTSSVSFHMLARCMLYLHTLKETPNMFFQQFS